MTAVSSLKNDLFRTNMKSCVTSLSFLQDLILLDCHCQLYEQFRAQIPIWDMYIIYIYQFRQSQLFSGSAPFTIFVAFWNRLLTSISLKILYTIKRKEILQEMVFCYQNCSEKKLFYWSRKTFEIRGWRSRNCKIFEITRKIYSSNYSEQFLVTECFFNLFLEVSHI